MIYQVSGDILLSKSQVLAHGVAANDPMNQGLAFSLHEKYPSMHKDYHHWCNQNHPAPGDAWVWAGAEGVRIVNLITQEGGYGHGSHPEKATLKHVRDSLKVLVKMIKKESFTSVALPKIATVAAVPIPAAIWLFMSGLIGLVSIRRRRGHKRAQVLNLELESRLILQ